MKKTYTIKKNHAVGKLAVYEIKNGKKLWIKNCGNTTDKQQAKENFLKFSQSCKDEYVRLGGDPSEFPEVEVVFYAD